MELKSLILGLALSLGAFALKSGAGLGYAMSGYRGRISTGMVLAAFTAGYGALFYLAARILDLADLTALYPKMETIFKSGMAIHMILAGLLALWGIRLLIRRPNKDNLCQDNLYREQPGRPSRAWLALALPCPVCFLVILLNTGLVSALYPDRPHLVWWLFSGFITASLAAALVFYLLGRGRQGINSLLGGVMLYMAAYFVLCITIIPQFGDLETVYRLSRPLFCLATEQGAGSSFPGGPSTAALPVAGAVLALAAGFFNPFKKRG